MMPFIRSALCFVMVTLVALQGLMHCEAQVQCPFSSPCSCVLDSNPVPTEKQRNILICADKDLTIPELPDVGDNLNVSFFKVNLSHNHLESVPVQFVQSLPGIEYVDLTDNTFQTLPDFPDLPQLRALRLSQNQLTEVGASSFAKTPNLNTLMLDNNALVTIPDSAFSRLDRLFQLTLSSNQLETLEPRSFQNLAQLDYLSLHNNHLVNLPDATFIGLISLHTLRLDKNKLVDLPETLFQPLTSLSRLDLDYNKVKFLPAKIFQPLSNLKTLYISGNSLRSLPERIFMNMESLQHLDISKNSIDHVSSQHFGPEKVFNSVTWLDFGSNTRLISFPYHFFEHFPNLEVLSLMKLKLKYLPHLSSLKRLEVLDVSGTSISHIFPCDFFGLESLKEFYWDEAPINCGCQSKWMKEWTDNYKKNLPRNPRLNPKNSLPDWDWNCRKPIQMLRKDFKDISLGDVSQFCKPGEIQQWCHEVKNATGAVDLDLKVGALLGKFNVSWSTHSEYIDIDKVTSGFRVLVQRSDKRMGFRIAKVEKNTTSILIGDITAGELYKLCIEVLGFSGTVIQKKCTEQSSLYFPATSANSVARHAVRIALPIVAALILVVIVVAVVFYLRKKGHFKDAQANTPDVAFVNDYVERVNEMENSNSSIQFSGFSNEITLA